MLVAIFSNPEADFLIGFNQTAHEHLLRDSDLTS